MFEHGPNTMAMDVAFWSLGLTNPDYPLDQLGALSLDISGKFRALAIMQLLTESSTDLFLHNLMRSGRARLSYLDRLAKAGVSDDHHQVNGRYQPLLDAIAAASWDDARRITQNVPAQFRPRHEYEDDYCYAKLLAGLIAVPAASEIELSLLLDRFDAWLDGQLDARWFVCRALTQRDQAEFDAAFEDVLLAHELAIDAARARSEHEDDRVLAERMVSIEGLALLRIATLRGLSTAPDYRYCPALARVPMRHPFPPL
ncbi:MAG: Imm49 family immunity protein [Polyangiales bacterium]